MWSCQVRCKEEEQREEEEDSGYEVRREQLKEDCCVYVVNIYILINDIKHHE